MNGRNLKTWHPPKTHGRSRRVGDSASGIVGIVLTYILGFLVALAVIFGLTLQAAAALGWTVVTNVLFWGWVATEADPTPGISYWAAAAFFLSVQLVIAGGVSLIRERRSARRSATFDPAPLHHGLTFSASIVILASPTEVFDFVTRPQLRRRWVIGVLQTEGASNGPLEPGARWRDVVKLSGLKWKASTIVREIEPARVFVTQSEADAYREKEIVRLRELEGSTEVTLEQLASYKGIYRILDPILRLHRDLYVRDHVQQNLRRLKSIVEDPSQELPRVSWTTMSGVGTLWLVVGGAVTGWLIGTLAL